MLLTDTHSHLYYETDVIKRRELMARCLEKKVNRIFLPNVNSSSVNLVLSLARDYPENCFPMLGLHPCDVKMHADDEVKNFKDELISIKQAIKTNKIYAIGEIGIDLYWDKSTLEIQKEAFILQIKWAKEMRLPVVIHCREAFNEIYEILIQENDEKLWGIFHCFTGSLEQAHQIIELGFYLGIGGVVTYKNSGLDKVVSQLSLNNMVLETDSPYLTPVPFRGKTNESSYLTYIAQKVADLKEINIEEVANITTKNSIRIFGI